MDGELDVFDFYLAEGLGKTLAEVEAMSNPEYVRWRAFYVWRNAQRDLERNKAKR